MNEKYSWKKTEEVEINLIDLLQKLCRQWKQIAVCAVIFACLLGGYRYIKDRSAVNATGTDTAIEEITLTKDEQQRVNGAIELSEEIAATEKYLEESILMNVDPYHKDRVLLLYSIDDATKSTKQKIVESYLTFLTAGGAIEAIQETDSERWDINKSYLSELISAYQRTDSSYQIVLEDTTAETLFYVEITGEDSKMAEQLAQAIQRAIEEYHDTAKKIAGKHILTLVSNEQGVKSDSSLATQQHDKNYQLSTNLASLKTLTDSFGEQQNLVYEEMLIEDAAEGTEQQKEAVSTGISKKWIVLGFVGGIFVYCCIFACFYLLRDTVKSMEELKTHYNFPVYGGILLRKGTKGTGEDLARNQRNQYEREKAQLLNRVRLACKKQKFTKICLATDFSLSEQEKSFMGDASKQLKEWGIDTVLGENMAGNVSMWDTLTEVGNVLMVYRIGTTTHQMIDEEMNFYTENNLQIVGVITIEH